MDYQFHQDNYSKYLRAVSNRPSTRKKYAGLEGLDTTPSRQLAEKRRRARVAAMQTRQISSAKDPLSTNRKPHPLLSGF